MENTRISEESKDLSLHPYRIEVQRIKEKHGDLDQIRMKLGMSQRQICRLLLVDPSAWTRWIKTDAPAHVYQALNWLLELKKTNPEAAGPVNLHTRVEKVEGLFAMKLQSLEKQILQIESLLGHWMIMQRNTQMQSQQQVVAQPLADKHNDNPHVKSKPVKKAKSPKKNKKNKRKKVRLATKKKTKIVLKKKSHKKSKSLKKKIKSSRSKARGRKNRR